jgi:hypothetical protein
MIHFSLTMLITETIFKYIKINNVNNLSSWSLFNYFGSQT